MYIATARYNDDATAVVYMLKHLNKKFEEKNKTLSVNQIKGICEKEERIGDKYYCLKQLGFPKDIGYCLNTNVYTCLAYE